MDYKGSTDWHSWIVPLFHICFEYQWATVEGEASYEIHVRINQTIFSELLKL